MKKIIFVAAPPARGKNYVSELICKALGNISYFDKDDLGVLLRRSFELCGEDFNMDGDFYLQNLRSAEYATLLNLSFSALHFSDIVLVNAPFLKEIRDVEYMRGLKERAQQSGAELILVWVIATNSVCYERMKARNSDRDAIKLVQWEKYVQQTDYSVPQALIENAAVDKLFVFDNENNEIARSSLKKLLEILGGQNA